MTITVTMSLRDDLITNGKGTDKLSEMIIKSVSTILKLQSVVTKKESESDILKRGIERGVILQRNVSINCIVTDLLSEKYCKSDEVLRFQHVMYLNEMEIKIGNIGREITSLNAIIAKERRMFKAITTDEIFKSCNIFLQKMKTNDFRFVLITNNYGRER